MSTRKPKRPWLKVDTTSRLKTAYCQVQEALARSKNDDPYHKGRIEASIREAMGSLTVALYNLKQPD